MFKSGYLTDNQDVMKLRIEQELNCDMIQMNFYDHYSNVTLDTVMALKFTIETIKSGDLGHIEFLMLADDDTYINVKTLVSLLYGQKPRILPVSL